MIKIEYKLVKWLEDGSYKKLPIIIKESAVVDFCEMIGWDGEEFANNTVRYPVEVDDGLDPISEDLVPKKKKKLVPKRHRRTKAEMKEARAKESEPEKKKKSAPEVLNKVVTKKRLKRFYPLEMLDFVKDHMNDMWNIELSKEVNKYFDLHTNNNNIKDYIKVHKLKRDKKIGGGGHQKYPVEMMTFIGENMEGIGNIELSELVNKKFGLETTPMIIRSQIRDHGLKRKKDIRGKHKKHPEKIQKKEKKMESKKKYTDEVLKYLRDNIDKMKNKQLCVELENRFNILTSTERLMTVMSNKGIRRDNNFKVNQKIVNYVARCGITDSFLLRDKIIEKFDINFSTADLNKIKGLAINKSKEESVPAEVERITKKRDGDDFEDDIDSMGLG